MIKKLFYTTFLFVISNIALAQTQIGGDINGEAAGDSSGWSVSTSSDGLILAVGAFGNDGNGDYSGHVRIYNYNAGIWTQLGNDINGEYLGDESGASLSLSSNGNIIAIGASSNSVYEPIPYSGHVRVYIYSSGAWIQLGGDINGEALQDQSGYSVSLSADGTKVAIGAMRNGGGGVNSGHVRIYGYSSGIWSQLGNDINGEAAGDFSGNSVSLSSDGTVVAIGARYNSNNDSGHVRVYGFNSGSWTQLGSDINGEAAGDYSGWSVSLSADGTKVAIGAPGNSGDGLAGSGHVRVYNYSLNSWTQLGNDIDGEGAVDTSGFSVSLSADGTIVAIGADQNDGNGTNSGHVRIYRFNAGVWTKIGSDIDGESASDKSGRVFLSSDGTKVAIGAPGNDGNGTDSGHVRVYDLSAILSSDSFVLSNFSVYPNPASEQVTITLQENLQLEKVTIYNTLGQLIKTEKNSSINVSSLSKGSYYFEVITNKGKATKTIVIQ